MTLTASSIIDFNKLSNLISAKQNAGGLTFEQISEQSSVPLDRLPICSNRAIEITNLLLLCAWLDIVPSDLLAEKAPEWSVRVLKEMSSFPPGEAAAVLIQTDKDAERHAEAMQGI